MALRYQMFLVYGRTCRQNRISEEWGKDPSSGPSGCPPMNGRGTPTHPPGEGSARAIGARFALATSAQPTRFEGTASVSARRSSSALDLAREEERDGRDREHDPDDGERIAEGHDQRLSFDDLAYRHD